MDPLAIFSAFGLSASAGLNAYIPLLVVALLGKYTDLIHLEEPWTGLTSWWIIGLLLVLSLIEFFADKFPVVNHVNDVIQSLVRPAAGAIAFAATSGALKDVNVILALGLGVLVAGSVNGVKVLAVRPSVTVTTAGAGNVPVSMAEDAVSTVVSILSVVVPVLIAFLMVMFTVWLIGMLWRRARRETS